MIYALGAFDGFHLGHRRLLDKAREEAEAKGCGWGVITFEGHPRMLLNRNSFKLLFTPPERDLIARFLGVKNIEKIRFSNDFAALSPREFVDYIGRRCSVNGLVIGENFRFGRRRSGDPAMLAKLAAERGWTLDVLPSYKIDGCVVSSTETRRAVEGGDMEFASRLLGYPFIISGRVIPGDARGRDLGFRTANIALKPGKTYPPEGVYAALSYIEGSWRTVALNIGSNPTFGYTERAPLCEGHVIGYNGELYNSTLFMFLIKRLRGERKFAGADELVKQINADTAECVKICDEYKTANHEMLEKFAEVL